MTCCVGAGAILRVGYAREEAHTTNPEHARERFRFSDCMEVGECDCAFACTCKECVGEFVNLVLRDATMGESFRASS